MIYFKWLLVVVLLRVLFIKHLTQAVWKIEMKFYNYTREQVADLCVAISCLLCPLLIQSSLKDEIACFFSPLAAEWMRWHWKLVRHATMSLFIACNNLPIFILFDFINTWVCGEKCWRGGAEEWNHKQLSSHLTKSTVPTHPQLTTGPWFSTASNLFLNTRIWQWRVNCARFGISSSSLT